MTEETVVERMSRKAREEHAAQLAKRAARKKYLERLFGGPDRLTWQTPQPIEDFDALLAQQAAQLRNAVHYTMEDVLEDTASIEMRSKLITAMTRMIQTNIAIAKVLGAKEPRAKSKTIHGVAAPQEPQD